MPIFSRILLALAFSIPLHAETIEKIAGQERLNLENARVAGLSGLTWAGGETFYAVSDAQKHVVPLTLKIDRATGRITHGEMGEPVEVPAPTADFEGIAYAAATKRLFISSEQGGCIYATQPGSPKVEKLTPPAIYAQKGKNLGLESLTWNDTVRQFWIANEEALTPDGPVSESSGGTLVRLQRLDPKFRPTAQYAWRTEPAGFRFRNAGNGVSDLCLLPNGNLIVLERGFGPGGLWVRLFLADFEGATDTTRLPALAGAEITPVKKTLLFAEPTGFTNFEGLTLGPVLDDGSFSLLVIADSNGGNVHSILPLKLRLAKTAARGTGK